MKTLHQGINTKLWSVAMAVLCDYRVNFKSLSCNLSTDWALVSQIIHGLISLQEHASVGFELRTKTSVSRYRLHQGQKRIYKTLSTNCLTLKPVFSRYKASDKASLPCISPLEYSLVQSLHSMPYIL